MHRLANVVAKAHNMAIALPRSIRSDFRLSTSYLLPRALGVDNKDHQDMIDHHDKYPILRDPHSPQNLSPEDNE